MRFALIRVQSRGRPVKFSSVRLQLVLAASLPLSVLCAKKIEKMPKNQKRAGTAIAASSRLKTHVKGYNSVLQRPGTLFVEVGDLVWTVNGMGDVAARMGSAGA